jgi:hypothetical protein
MLRIEEKDPDTPYSNPKASLNPYQVWMSHYEATTGRYIPEIDPLQEQENKVF